MVRTRARTVHWAEWILFRLMRSRRFELWRWTVVNRQRIDRGRAPLEIGDGVAAQYVAEQALEALRLADYTQDGLPLEVVYTATGGRGAMMSSGEIRGYFDTAELTQCRSALVICTRTDPEAYLSEYVDVAFGRNVSGGSGESGCSLIGKLCMWELRTQTSRLWWSYS